MTTLESIRIVAGHFNGLGIPYTFLGASVLPLLVDRPDILEIRSTLDVDLTVEIATLADFYRLEEKLRAIGFQNDTREGAPICRWIADGVTVDVMPTEASVLGMSSEWFREAVRNAVMKDLGEDVNAPVIGRPYFLATKLTAYRDRGARDPYMSKDLEDIVTLFNGCDDTNSLLDRECKPMCAYVIEELRACLANGEFSDAVEGCFRTDPVSRERANIVKVCMHRLCDIPLI
jgi:predicted nucleotidyltransferase